MKRTLTTATNIWEGERAEKEEGARSMEVTKPATVSQFTKRINPWCTLHQAHPTDTHVG